MLALIETNMTYAWAISSEKLCYQWKELAYSQRFGHMFARKRSHLHDVGNGKEKIRQNLIWNFSQRNFYPFVWFLQQKKCLLTWKSCINVWLYFGVALFPLTLCFLNRDHTDIYMLWNKCVQLYDIIKISCMEWKKWQSVCQWVSECCICTDKTSERNDDITT